MNHSWLNPGPSDPSPRQLTQKLIILHQHHITLDKSHTWSYYISTFLVNTAEMVKTQKTLHPEQLYQLFTIFSEVENWIFYEKWFLGSTQDDSLMLYWMMDSWTASNWNPSIASPLSQLYQICIEKMQSRSDTWLESWWIRPDWECKLTFKHLQMDGTSSGPAEVGLEIQIWNPINSRRMNKSLIYWLKTIMWPGSWSIIKTCLFDVNSISASFSSHCTL